MRLPGSTCRRLRLRPFAFACLRLALLAALALHLQTAAAAIQAAPANDEAAATSGPWYVAPAGNDANSCLSAAAPCATIRGAIQKASPGDKILVAIGTYSTALGGDDVIANMPSITLSGGWDASFSTQAGLSIVDGLGVLRPMHVHNTVTVERFVFRNGTDTAIWNEGNLTLKACVVGDMAEGPGINNYATLTINNSTISGSTSSGSGGGIYNIGTLTLNNSTVSGNSSQLGGGIWNGAGGQASLNNTTISGNSATRGGGISLGPGSVTLQNSIVAGNSASSTGPDCDGILASNGYNLVGDTAGCTLTGGSSDLRDISPELAPLSDNGGATPTQALPAGSPAVNAGNPAGCADQFGNPLLVDQRGIPRSGRCDMGAYEWQPPTAPTDVVVSGPSQGHLDTNYAFVATVSPINATLPITYAWTITGQEPVTHTLKSLSDSIDATWTSPGPKTISVRVTNGLGGVDRSLGMTVLYPTLLPIIVK